MIMVIPQLISCGITMKSEILDDYAAPFAPGALAGPGAALSGTTHH
jgi:hypothetical protein